MTIIDRFAAVAADLEATRAAEAAEKTRSSAAARRVAWERECARLSSYFPPEILALGWLFEPGERHLNTYASFTLVPTFLPADVSAPRLRAEFTQTRGAPSPSLVLHGGGGSWRFEVGASVEAVEAILAPIITNHIALCRERAERARQAEEARIAGEERQQRERARQARLDDQLALMARRARVEIAEEIAGLRARFGWPEGGEVRAYEMTWTEGTDGDGNVQKSDPLYLLDPNPDEHGFYTTLRSRDAPRVRVSGTAVVTHEVVWRSVQALPYGLRETTYCSRYVEIWAADGTERLASCVEAGGESDLLPSPSIRRVLGIDASEIGRPRTATIAVRETADGFEPFAPSAQAQADADADLPY